MGIGYIPLLEMRKSSRVDQTSFIQQALNLLNRGVTSGLRFSLNKA